MGLLRGLLLWAVLTTVAYLIVSVYSRSVRREKLEREWDSDPAREGATEAERDAFIEKGMADYRRGMRRRLILLVYVVPVVVAAVTVYLVNFQ